MSAVVINIPLMRKLGDGADENQGSGLSPRPFLSCRAWPLLQFLQPQASVQGPAQGEAGADGDILYFLLGMGQGLLAWLSSRQSTLTQLVSGGLRASRQAHRSQIPEPVL